MRHKKIYFKGDKKELIELLKELCPPDKWNSTNGGTHLYNKGDVTVSWAISSGRISIQGKVTEDQIEKIEMALQNHQNGIIENEQKKSASVEECSSEIETKILSDKNKNPSNENFVNSGITSYSDVYRESEIVIGLVGATGTDLNNIVSIISERLKHFKYESEIISVSEDVIRKWKPITTPQDEFDRIKSLMDDGNELRRKTEKNEIIALGIADIILDKREKENDQSKPRKRCAYIVKSIKHSAEVRVLRELYGTGFCLIGISEDESRRIAYLTNDKSIKNNQAKELIDRDEDESFKYGQHTRDTFQMADFFVQKTNNADRVKESLWRMIDIMFGDPYKTPTFDEYAMFQAFVSSLRSADLSRQVGAVIANDNNEIVAYGANDCPRFGGGLYWPNADSDKIVDEAKGRDYMRKEDSNKANQREIVEDIVTKLTQMGISINDEVKASILTSRIKDLTEYGRVVHAEMEALLMCARNNISTRNATLFCTTFPCHNCAKHLIAAGIQRVVYVEPYPKSKAFDFYEDAIRKEDDSSKPIERVVFSHFTGVGPRRFFDLFSTSLSSGYIIERKHADGRILDWKREQAVFRIPLQPVSYLEKEMYAAMMYKRMIEEVKNE